MFHIETKVFKSGTGITEQVLWINNQVTRNSLDRDHSSAKLVVLLWYFKIILLLKLTHIYLFLSKGLILNAAHLLVEYLIVFYLDHSVILAFLLK